MLVMLLICLYRKPKQTAIFSFMQRRMLIIDVSCIIRLESTTMIVQLCYRMAWMLWEVKLVVIVRHV